MAGNKRKTRQQLAQDKGALQKDIDETKKYISDKESSGKSGLAHNARAALYVKESHMEGLRREDKARTPKRKLTMWEKAVQYLKG